MCRYGLTDEQKADVDSQYADLLDAASLSQGCSTQALTGAARTVCAIA